MQFDVNDAHIKIEQYLASRGNASPQEVTAFMKGVLGPLVSEDRALIKDTLSKDQEFMKAHPGEKWELGQNIPSHLRTDETRARSSEFNAAHSALVDAGDELNRRIKTDHREAYQAVDQWLTKSLGEGVGDVAKEMLGVKDAPPAVKGGQVPVPAAKPKIAPRPRT